MKHYIFISLLSVLIGLSSCDARMSSDPSLIRARGASYDIGVVTDKDVWNGTVGDMIKEELSAPVPYILQFESSMKYSYVSPELFDRNKCYTRNVLIVNIDMNQYTKLSVQKSRNDWATGQAVIRINAPNVQLVEEYLTENKGSLLKFYDVEEMRRSREALAKVHSVFVTEKLKEKFGVSMYVPKDIVKFKESEDGLWFSNDAVKWRTDVLVYSFPYTDKNTFTLEYMVAKRDSIAKAMVPGSLEGSYMKTEKRVVDYFSSSLNGKYCGILKGMWRMEGDMMGGPFVSYARLDEANNRIIVAEGFVYEPQLEKRQYIRRIEAALQTLLLPGEQNIALVE